MIRREVKVVIEMIVRCYVAATDDSSTEYVEVKGRLLDLTTDGAMLMTKQGFDVGQELRLAIVIPDQPRVSLRAVVRWVKPIPDKNLFAPGVQFIDPPAKGVDIIKRFLRQLGDEV